ncbi:hypothetical protein CLV58_1109 [Spirosoma oryzae]|uniref:PIN domain-containing protein n=1 Tax=Spirosoma oryzae TaxID=1469603 RepID=A0A2T0SVX3_9BACT|nr:putative toxin-antitoxin system toxin component, PIN family [Spirosoma oryzae]PRY37540.1 hypothetical protein CLV58_1109 [Spirosoma oryzae]
MPGNKARLIVDTNLWISFLLTNNYVKLDQLLNKQLATLLFSDRLFAEFIDVACRPKFRKFFSLDDLNELTYQLRNRAEFIDVSSVVVECRDEKDDFLLALAVDGRATHLITGDKDLLDMQQFRETRILTIAEYLVGGPE